MYGACRTALPTIRGLRSSLCFSGRPWNLLVSTRGYVQINAPNVFCLPYHVLCGTSNRVHTRAAHPCMPHAQARTIGHTRCPRSLASDVVLNGGALGLQIRPPFARATGSRLLGRPATDGAPLPEQLPPQRAQHLARLFAGRQPGGARGVLAADPRARKFAGPRI